MAGDPSTRDDSTAPGWLKRTTSRISRLWDQLSDPTTREPRGPHTGSDGADSKTAIEDGQKGGDSALTALTVPSDPWELLPERDEPSLAEAVETVYTYGLPSRLRALSNGTYLLQYFSQTVISLPPQKQESAVDENSESEVRTPLRGRIDDCSLALPPESDSNQTQAYWRGENGSMILPDFEWFDLHAGRDDIHSLPLTFQPGTKISHQNLGSEGRMALESLTGVRSVSAEEQDLDMYCRSLTIVPGMRTKEGSADGGIKIEWKCRTTYMLCAPSAPGET